MRLQPLPLAPSLKSSNLSPARTGAAKHITSAMPKQAPDTLIPLRVLLMCFLLRERSANSFGTQHEPDYLAKLHIEQPNNRLILQQQTVAFCSEPKSSGRTLQAHENLSSTEITTTPPTE